jgi:hypothetical protein
MRVGGVTFALAHPGVDTIRQHPFPRPGLYNSPSYILSDIYTKEYLQLYR